MLLLAAACGIAVVSGQEKINLLGQMKLQQLQTETRMQSADGKAPVAGVMVMLADGGSAAPIESLGGEIVSDLGNILTVNIPVNRIQELSELPDVEYVEYGVEYKPLLDFARPASMVTEAHAGVEYDGVSTSYTGKGVTVGLMDQGIEPNHINFQGRVRAVYDYWNGVRRYETPTAVAGYTTDINTESHGTHVAGIMAGSYNGTGRYAYVTSPTGRNSSVTNGNIPYYGIATESDIVMSAGSFSTSNVVNGVTAIINSAEQNGQPAVVNLSLGSNIGPHDGSDMLSQSLASLGKRGIICVASGNEGDQPISVVKTFTSSDNQLKTFVQSNQGEYIDIWGNDNKPFKVTVALYATSNAQLTQICSVNGAGQSGTSQGAFNTYFTGSFSMLSEVNRLNNRYHVTINGSFKQRASGRNFAIIIEGSEGQTAYVYGNDATLFTNNRLSGWDNGSAAASISDTATGDNIIAVGSYTTRTTWGLLSGGSMYYTNPLYAVGEVSPFSSYGKNFQGKSLPVVCAPGANIISSYSRYALSNSQSGYSTSQMTASTGSGAATNYWGPMQGTSMACPYASGVVALWLQADPTLEYADVLDIIQVTSIKKQSSGGIFEDDEDDEDAIRWGAGKIDAVAGIKEVLRRKVHGGVTDVTADADELRLVVTPAGEKVYSVFVAGETAINASLYSAAGVLVANAKADADEVTVDASHVAPGVYVLAVDGKTGHYSRRVLVK